jgi:hypothetical protein
MEERCYWMGEWRVSTLQEVQLIENSCHYMQKFCYK